MVFNVAYPDKWYGGQMPQLNLDKSLYENAEAELEVVYKTLLSMIGEKREQASFAQILMSNSLMIENAFYLPIANSITIFPFYLLPPLIDSKYLSMMYVGAEVFGHEVSHGFDADGSFFDGNGCIHYWWTVNDRMEFDKRNSLLIAISFGSR